MKNVYVVNGDVIRRQKVGIPMGTNAAPALAHCYLYAYESAFIDRLLNENRTDIARKFHTTWRYIDDVLALDNEFWSRYSSVPSERGGIYPKALTLNDTSISLREVNFLGMRITERSNRLHMDVFDKRKEFPFRVQRYPRMASLIPQSIPYGVMTGQLYRYSRICTAHGDFLRHACGLARILISQGCRKGRMLTTFNTFLSKLDHLPWPQVDRKTLYRAFRSRLGSC